MAEQVLIIAEAGVNHNGSLKLAKKLARTAKECGADVVKFQTAKLDALVSESAPMAEYQQKNMRMEKSQKSMLEKLLLPFEDFIQLADYCREIGIQFLSTPFDIESIRFLNRLQDMWKIPSGEITNYPYLVEIAKTGKNVILSTGMSSLKEIDEALYVLETNGTGTITLLHCTTGYPACMRDVNLRAMLTMKEHCKCPAGYSDHTKGIEVAVAAAALGAVVIEKHFTLDQNMEGPDHKASLEPDELTAMIQAVRNVETAMGNGIKMPAESEKRNMAAVRKSITAARNIKMGELLTEENLTAKRPGAGISPMKWKEVTGTKAIRDFKKDELIEL